MHETTEGLEQQQECGTWEVQEATKMPSLPDDNPRDTCDEEEWSWEYEGLSGYIVWNGHNGDYMMDSCVMVSQDGLSQ